MDDLNNKKKLNIIDVLNLCSEKEREIKKLEKELKFSKDTIKRLKVIDEYRIAVIKELDSENNELFISVQALEDVVQEKDDLIQRLTNLEDMPDENDLEDMDIIDIMNDMGVYNLDSIADFLLPIFEKNKN